MSRPVLAAAISIACAAVGAFLILSNVYPGEGPWLPISPSHGIHVGDVVIVLIWAGVTALLVRWARAARTR